MQNLKDYQAILHEGKADHPELSSVVESNRRQHSTCCANCSTNNLGKGATGMKGVKNKISRRFCNINGAENVAIIHSCLDTPAQAGAQPSTNFGLLSRSTPQATTG
jgi:hypothetical protein